MDPITFTGADEEEPFRSNLAILEMHYGTSVPGACEWHLSNWGGHFLEWVCHVIFGDRCLRNHQQSDKFFGAPDSSRDERRTSQGVQNGDKLGRFMA